MKKIVVMAFTLATLAALLAATANAHKLVDEAMDHAGIRPQAKLRAHG